MQSTKLSSHSQWFLPFTPVLSPATSVGHWAEGDIRARETAGYNLPHAQRQFVYGVSRVQHTAAAVTSVCTQEY